MSNSNAVSVLLVEDNPVDREAVRRAFAKQRIENPIIDAEDGVAALEVLRSETAPLPVLVLLDLNMPRMNGIKFLQTVRADPGLKNTIIFVLTTSKSEQDKLDAYGHNVAGYMVKSDVGKGFVNLVKMLDHYWRVVVFPEPAT